MMLQDRGAVLTGLALGAGLMYFGDPERGRRRRARMRDRCAHALAVTRHAAGATGRDVAHRAKGVAAKARGAIRRKDTADDRVLEERVRARIGRLVSHPHAIRVAASQGVVTLQGPVLRDEARRLRDAVRRVPGVHQLVDALEEHDDPTGISALQGGRNAAGPRREILQQQWSPTTRLVAGAAGLGLTVYGAARRSTTGAFLAAAGLALFTRAATNLEARRLVGIGASRRAVDVQKTITIDKPVDEVFRFWSAYENFPRFMSHVLDVRPGAREGQSHWTVAGPGGMRVSFDAEITAFEPNRRLAWQTLDGSTVAHAGLVQFEPVGDHSTRVHIRMSYNPPGGWLGHELASAFGVDPKHSFDADLVRMKTLIETGRVPHDAAQPAAH